MRVSVWGKWSGGGKKEGIGLFEPLIVAQHRAENYFFIKNSCPSLSPSIREELVTQELRE